MEKISKLNIHSIIKKSNRVSSHLKHLTGFAPQVRSLCLKTAFRAFGRGELLGLIGMAPFLVPPLVLLAGKNR
jgi:hypothetical protein